MKILNQNGKLKLDRLDIKSKRPILILREPKLSKGSAKDIVQGQYKDLSPNGAARNFKVLAPIQISK